MTPDEKEVYDMKLLLDENDNWKHILIDAGKLMTEAEEQLEDCVQTESEDWLEGMRWVLADIANAMRYDEVDAVPVVHGKWVFNENDDMFYCTNCKNGSVRNDYPYCHWCGAKMDVTDTNVGNKDG